MNPNPKNRFYIKELNVCLVHFIRSDWTDWGVKVVVCLSLSVYFKFFSAVSKLTAGKNLHEKIETKGSCENKIIKDLFLSF